MMEGIVHSNGDLLADLLEEFYVLLTVGFLLQACESHGPHPSHRRGQRNDAEGIDAVLLHEPGDAWPAAFFGKIRNEERLLRLPHQSTRRIFDRAFVTTHDVGGNIRLNGV